jgi:hypothetical protein
MRRAGGVWGREAVSYDEPTFEEVDQHAQALAEIERLRAALANEQARGVHTCHEHCERPMCVMQRAITERDSTIERLRARLADGELDTVRLLHLAKEPFFDEYGGVDLHEEASINASVFGRDEPNHNDYLAALRTAIDTAMGESREL